MYISNRNEKDMICYSTHREYSSMSTLDTHGEYGFIHRETSNFKYSIWNVMNHPNLFRVVNELTGDTIYEHKEDYESDDDFIEKVGFLLVSRQLQSKKNNEIKFKISDSYWDVTESTKFLVCVPECRGMISIMPSIDKKFWKAEINEHGYIGIGKNETEAIRIVENRINLNDIFSYTVK